MNEINNWESINNKKKISKMYKKEINQIKLTYVRNKK